MSEDQCSFWFKREDKFKQPKARISFLLEMKEPNREPDFVDEVDDESGDESQDESHVFRLSDDILEI